MALTAVSMRALVGHRVTYEVTEGDSYLVPAERAVSLASCGWATPEPVPEWWPEELLAHARAESEQVVRVRSSATRGRPVGHVHAKGPDHADDALVANWGAPVARRRVAAAEAAYPRPKREPWRVQ